MRFYFLLAIAMAAGALCATADVRSEVSTCPLDCEAAALWCTQTFVNPTNTGIMTAECDMTPESSSSFTNGLPESFQCVCNGNEAVQVDVGASGCTWQKGFDEYPGGGNCTPTTGVCPKRCAEIPTTECVSSNCVEEILEDGLYYYQYTCTTCEGRVYNITGTSAECKRDYTDTPKGCVPETTCNGHGCCTAVSQLTNTPICKCYHSQTDGYFAQPFCRDCLQGYDSSKGKLCTNPTPIIQLILSNISTTWAMVLPNMAVMFLFVVLGIARRMWDSDTTFDLTWLRRAKLSPMQCAQRGQPSRFHSKYIPRRPAKSRCFANGQPKDGRGPPAY